MKPRLVLLLGIALVVAVSALWHGPLGNGAARFVYQAEELTRRNLDYYEVGSITPFLEREPLTRRLWLTGEADDFQQAELKRIFMDIPGIGDVQWANAPGQPMAGGTVRGRPLLPLIVEVELLGLAGYGIGLMLAFFLFGRERVPNRFNI